jgi:hypothetical protein
MQDRCEGTEPIKIVYETLLTTSTAAQLTRSQI